MKSKKDFFLEAYQLEFIKFGRFTLKSGLESPFYVDLRPLASDPKILQNLAQQLLSILPESSLDLICGVPYAALPMATAMSIQSGIPLIIKRKEAKSYGTKKLIEGIFEKGQSCLLVEDVITSGESLLETLQEVENEGLKVSDIVVVLDREQGGKQILEEKGYRVHTLFTISEAVEILREVGKLEDDEIQRIKNFLEGNKVVFSPEKRISYQEKKEKVRHKVGKKLLEIALNKRSNLIASADVTTTAELLELAEEIGEEIIALKTHMDILEDFQYEKTIVPLKKIADKYGFLLMEDRKFADIGNTQELQFKKGIYKISDWADMVTSHLIAGEKSLNVFDNVGIIAILGMSSKETLTDPHYRQGALKIIENHPNIMGCVAQNKVKDDVLLFTPGVHLATKGDDKGQQYNTPEYVFEQLYTDFIIVGRGMYQSENPKKAAQQYRKVGWEAYEKSLQL